MIDRLVYIAAIVIGAVVISTLIYRVLPFYPHKPKRPLFVLFPKYKASFDGPVEDIQQSLTDLKFTPTKPGSLTYERGKVYGDFSAKLVKLHAKIDPGGRTLTICTPVMGVLFDTGDLWQVTADILNGAKKH